MLIVSVRSLKYDIRLREKKCCLLKVKQLVINTSIFVIITYPEHTPKNSTPFKRR